MTTSAMRRGESGQAFILAILVMTIVSTMIAFGVLSRTQRGYRESVELKREIYVISTFNSAALMLKSMFSATANCEVFTFNRLLNALPGRVLQVGDDFVRVGSITPRPISETLVAPPLGTRIDNESPRYYNDVGFGAKDVEVNLFMIPYGRLSHSEGAVRYEQRVVLINDCLEENPMEMDTTLTAEWVGPQFNTITEGSVLARGSGISDARFTSCRTLGPCRYVGSMDRDPIINNTDRKLFKHYLKTKELQNPTHEIAAMDLNNDGTADSVDLGILEKTLKGYLYLFKPFPPVN